MEARITVFESGGGGGGGTCIRWIYCKPAYIRDDFISRFNYRKVLTLYKKIPKQRKKKKRKKTKPGIVMKIRISQLPCKYAWWVLLTFLWICAALEMKIPVRVVLVLREWMFLDSFGICQIRINRKHNLNFFGRGGGRGFEGGMRVDRNMHYRDGL